MEGISAMRKILRKKIVSLNEFSKYNSSFDINHGFMVIDIKK